MAVCNDCHVPHDLVGKYYTKARNGFWHSFYFTTQTFHEPIRATPRQPQGHRGRLPLLPRRRRPGDGHSGRTRRATEISCIRCHGSVGHMELFATDVRRDRP